MFHLFVWSAYLFVYKKATVTLTAKFNSECVSGEAKAVFNEVSNIYWRLVCLTIEDFGYKEKNEGNPYHSHLSQSILKSLIRSLWKNIAMSGEKGS